MDYEKIVEDVEVEFHLDMSKVFYRAHDTEEVLDELTSVEDLEAAQKANREFLPENDPRFQGIAAARGYSQETHRLQRVHYTHDAMIDVILASPSISQKELAAKFEVSAAWISRVFGSDAFQAALAKRRADISDPFVVATMEERIKGLAFQSLEVLATKLEETQNADLALKSLDIAGKALGFGARSAPNNVQNNFVVQLPPKAASAEDWASKHKVIEG